MSDHADVGATKLAGRLPKNDAHNGLDAIAAAAVADPDGYEVMVVASLVVKTVTSDIAKQEQTPTLQVARIEPLAGGLAAAARNLLADAKRRRTGASGHPELSLRTGSGVVLSGPEFLDPDADDRDAGGDA